MNKHHDRGERKEYQTTGEKKNAVQKQKKTDGKKESKTRKEEKRKKVKWKLQTYKGVKMQVKKVVLCFSKNEK